MERMARSCTQSLLKLSNSVVGMVDIAMILYSAWMIRVWYRHTTPPALSSIRLILIPSPGVFLCVISCSGHVAAETAHGCCLYLYMIFIFFLLMAEAAVTGDVFLNHDWEEDFPKDASRNLDQLRDFVKENFVICKWIGLSIVSVQGLCIPFAMVLKGIGPVRNYDTDDDLVAERVALLKNAAGPPYFVGDPAYVSKNDVWSIRINEKVRR